MDPRLDQLQAWLVSVLPEFAGLDRGQWEVVPVSGDASFRRYFRVQTADESWIAVDAPPEKEDSRPFVNVAESLAAFDVSVPDVHKYDYEQGFMLLGDLGDELYLNHLSDQTVDELYAQALDALHQIQRCPDLKNGFLPSYDLTLLQREVELFREWFLQKLLGMSLTEEDHFEADRLFHLVIDCALEQPTVFVHRDYHSRNIMLRPGEAPGIIDFQDAVKGPVTYDLVSLLRDCYIAWPDEKVYSWVENFRLALITQGRMMPDTKHFQRWFDLMGSQRHLKAIGIFSRLLIRDNKSGYLQDIPRTFGYLQKVVGKTHELQPVAAWFNHRVIPAMYACEHLSNERLDQWVLK